MNKKNLENQAIFNIAENGEKNADTKATETDDSAASTNSEETVCYGVTAKASTLFPYLILSRDDYSAGPKNSKTFWPVIAGMLYYEDAVALIKSYSKPERLILFDNTTGQGYFVAAEEKKDE